jgi:membrane protease YdiL (CAAX protease family)
MNWLLAMAAPAVVAGVLALSGTIHPAILAYHLLCAVAVYRRRGRVRELLRGGRSVAAWIAGTTAVIVGALLLAPFVEDPSPYRALFRRTLLPWGRPELTFAIFAVYTMAIHAPLEEVFWRGVVMDPERASLGTALPGNALFFGLLHAAPMAIILGARGALMAIPALAAGAVWAFVTIRSRSLWPSLVSHWGTDGVILGLMWFYFIR